MKTIFIKAHLHQPQYIKCSINDHFVSRIAVPFASFYANHIKEDVMINALQHVLNDFPIFAGVLIKKEGELYIDCNNQGVSLSVVHDRGSLLKQLSWLEKLKLSTFIEPIHPSKAIKKQMPVLTIKLSYFCDGMAIGYCCHHSIADMSTFMAFLKAFSFCVQEKSYLKPHIVPDREGYLHDCFNKFKEKIYFPSCLKRLNIRDILSFVKQFCSSKRGAYFYFTQDEMNSLRSALSAAVKQKLSHNDVLCAHLLHVIGQCRKDKNLVHNASIVTNIRSLLEMPSNTLGNYCGTVWIQNSKQSTPEALACAVHVNVKKYFPSNPAGIQDFIQTHGGMKNILKCVPFEFLPSFKNLIISNCAYYNTYSIDFGMKAPYLLLPLGILPRPDRASPWVSVMVKGFHNRGVLVALVLPSSIMKRLTTPASLEKIHQYRTQISREDAAILEQFSWCK
ncbi:MAG: acyltransferase [Chlamydiales bacterium]|nr:acyltransferase [Chlamydiales bacterium]